MRSNAVIESLFKHVIIGLQFMKST